MKDYTSEMIRNVALLGHGGCGKTTFLEAALLATGVITRLGKVEDGSTVSDYDKMEIEKGYSINTTLVPVEYNNVKINFVDTPGFFDFAGEVQGALRGVEAAAIVVDASAGVQVGTEKAWDACKKIGSPKFIILNKIDKENVDVAATIQQLQDKFGNAVVTLEDKDAMAEAIAEVDEELMDIYFNEGGFTDEQFSKGLTKGILQGDIVPVFKCSSLTGEGVKEVLQEIIEFVPNPTIEGYRAKDENQQPIIIKANPDDKPVLFIFKTLADSFLGKISLAKVVSGKVSAGMTLHNFRVEKDEKLGSVFFVRGKEKIDCKAAVAGDIVALGKLEFTKTGDTLSEKSNPTFINPVEFPQPTLFMAIETADKGADDKLSTGFARLTEEDPTLALVRNKETRQTLVGGQGESQLNIALSKLKTKYGVSVNVVPQKIAYRETIKGTSDVQGKHKKQSGGSGQYGDVHIKFAPSAQEFEFSEELFGGSVPKQYVPAVEKGLLECMERGPLAGCKVQNVKATLYDGSYHPVDSNETAFKIAASLAFKKGIAEAKPVLLEPIGNLKVYVPDSNTGDIIGDLNKRRGRVLGMNPSTDGLQEIEADVPMSEMADFATAIRSLTQGRGYFTFDFARYEQLPSNLEAKVIEDAKKFSEEE